MTVVSHDVDAVCPICFDDRKKEYLAHKTDVKIFHLVGCPECVSKWIQQGNATCPICRTSLINKNIVQFNQSQDGKNITETDTHFLTRFPLSTRTDEAILDDPSDWMRDIEALREIQYEENSVMAQFLSYDTWQTLCGFTMAICFALFSLSLLWVR